jgi:hypothetical protein
VDLGAYHARIGSFAANYKRKNTTEGWKVQTNGWETWFWGFVLMMMLVIGGVEVNPGLPVEQEKIHQILTHAKSGKGVTSDKKILQESHNQEMDTMKKRTFAPGSKFEKLTEIIDEVTSDYKEIKQLVRQWEERQKMANE